MLSVFSGKRLAFWAIGLGYRFGIGEGTVADDADGATGGGMSFCRSLINRNLMSVVKCPVWTMVLQSRPCGLWRLATGALRSFGPGYKKDATRRWRRKRLRPSRWRRQVGSDRGQRLLQVGDDVVDVLDADRQAHHVGRYAGLGQFRRRQLAVGGRGRVAGE